MRLGIPISDASDSGEQLKKRRKASSRLENLTTRKKAQKKHGQGKKQETGNNVVSHCVIVVLKAVVSLHIILMSHKWVTQDYPRQNQTTRACC